MKKETKETFQALFFIGFAILILVQSCISLEHGQEWQGIAGIMVSLYMIMFVHAARIAKNINLKIEEKNDHEIKENDVMKNKNIKMFIIILFLLICAMFVLLPLGSKALENDHIFQGVILIMLSLYMIMFVHAEIIAARVNQKLKDKREEEKEN